MPLKNDKPNTIVGPTLPPSYVDKSDTKLNASPTTKNTNENLAHRWKIYYHQLQK